MPEVVLFIASSVDGYIARSDGGVDWLFHDQDYGYSEFMAEVGVVLMGRITYEQILTFGDYPYHGTQGFVLSRSRAGQRDTRVEFTDSPVDDLVTGLKAAQAKNLWLIGGGQVIKEFLRLDLIDRIVLSIHPVILGEGLLLFPPATPQRNLALTNCQAYETGLVQLTYRRQR